MFRLFTPIVALCMLAACTTSTTPSTLASDINLIAMGVQPVITAVEAIPGVSSTLLATIAGYDALIQKDSAIVATTTGGTQISTVQEIASTVEALAAASVTLLPGGSATVTALDAAVSLAEVIITEAQTANGVTPAATSAVAMKYTPDQARLILRGFTAK